LQVTFSHLATPTDLPPVCFSSQWRDSPNSYGSKHARYMARGFHRFVHLQILHFHWMANLLLPAGKGVQRQGALGNVQLWHRFLWPKVTLVTLLTQGNGGYVS
jgi:hypothetical protein